MREPQQPRRSEHAALTCPERISWDSWRDGVVASLCVLLISALARYVG